MADQRRRHRPSRPYLQLGFSDNVQVVADDVAAGGLSDRRRVRIDGEPLDLAATYTVSTLIVPRSRR